MTVGWVERSETHQGRSRVERPSMGFATLNPSYSLPYPLSYRDLACVVARGVGFRYILRMIAARPVKARLQLFAPRRDRLRCRLGALFDPLHEGVEPGCELRGALSRVDALVRESLHQAIAAARRLDGIPIGGLRLDHDLRIVDRMDRYHRHPAAPRSDRRRPSPPQPQPDRR